MKSLINTIDLYKDTGKETKEQGTELSSSASMNETNWTVQEIVHSRAFWVFTLSDLIIAGTATAFFFHLRGAFKESGVSVRLFNLSSRARTTPRTNSFLAFALGSKRRCGRRYYGVLAYSFAAAVVAGLAVLE